MPLPDWLIAGGIICFLIAAAFWLVRQVREGDAAEIERERRRAIERARLEQWEKRDAERLARRRAKDKGGGPLEPPP
jgi:hypothetical protein